MYSLRGGSEIFILVSLTLTPSPSTPPALPSAACAVMPRRSMIEAHRRSVWRHTSSISRPLHPSDAPASKSSSASGRWRAYRANMAARAVASGGGKCTWTSKRERSAGSRSRRRLVAPISAVLSCAPRSGEGERRVGCAGHAASTSTCKHGRAVHDPVQQKDVVSGRRCRSAVGVGGGTPRGVRGMCASAHRITYGGVESVHASQEHGEHPSARLVQLFLSGARERI